MTSSTDPWEPSPASPDPFGPRESAKLPDAWEPSPGQTKLFMSTLVIAASSGLYVAFLDETVKHSPLSCFWTGVVVWAAVMVVNPLVSALAVLTAVTLFRLALIPSNPDLEDRLEMGALWPIVLVFSLVVSPFAAVTNRVFKD